MVRIYMGDVDIRMHRSLKSGDIRMVVDLYKGGETYRHETIFEKSYANSIIDVLTDFVNEKLDNTNVFFSTIKNEDD